MDSGARKGFGASRPCSSTPLSFTAKRRSSVGTESTTSSRGTETDRVLLGAVDREQEKPCRLVNGAGDIGVEAALPPIPTANSSSGRPAIVGTGTHRRSHGVPERYGYALLWFKWSISSYLILV